MSDITEHTGTIPATEVGNRLDQSLARMFPQFSRSRLQTWIKQGNVTVDGEQRRARDTVYGGEAVFLRAVVEAHSELTAESMPLDVVLEDEHFLIVNKPVGLVVHPGAGNPAGTLVNGLLSYDPALADLPRAGLVHRLDKDTSGILIVARNHEAFSTLTEALARRDIKREYLALCVGRLTGGGTIDAPIGRHPVERKKMAVRDGGRPARTHYRIAQRFRGYTLLDVSLDTGRTHQIRVHFAHQQAPLVGDPVYGRPAFPKGASEGLRALLAGFRRQALHAARLSFVHPHSGEPVSASCPLPADFEALLSALAVEQSVDDESG